MAQIWCLLFFSNLCFELMLWQSWKMCRWYVKAVVKQHWSNWQRCNISWTVRIFCFYEKNVHLRQRWLKLSTRLDTPRITQWNQILKSYINDWDEQTQLFTVSELHANISWFEKNSLFQETRFSRQAESFLAFLPYEPRMLLKCFLIFRVQITIPTIPMFLCSCAEKKQKQNKTKQNKKRAGPCAIKVFQQLQKM